MRIEAEIGKLFFQARKSWTLKDFLKDRLYHDLSKREIFLNWLLSVSIDLDHMDGDPSGIHCVVMGSEIMLFYPTHIGWELVWSLGDPSPKIFRWDPRK